MPNLNNFRNIHIGKLIQKRMSECNVDIDRACNFLKVSEEDIKDMFDRKSLESELLLHWSKLLEYDFFRIYSQHLILYAPQDINKTNREKNTSLPVFKKNIYTHEVIMYLLELIESGRKNKRDVQQEYNIPSTTINRWMRKYGNNTNKPNGEEEKTQIEQQ